MGKSHSNKSRLRINTENGHTIRDLAQSSQEKRPKVCIKCITYNHEPYIRDALDGFIMQKTDFPFVAIVHDDASSDGTVAIIREYAEKYPDIIKPIYEKENQYSKKTGSVTHIMNEACKKTGAQYIAICEGDDYWTDPMKLQKQVDFLESHPEYSMCSTNVNSLDQNSGKVKRRNISKKNIISFDDLLLRGNQISTLSAVFRAKYIDDYSNLIKPKWPLGDYPLWLYLTLHGPAYIIPDTTSVYRILRESASHFTSVKKQFLFDMAVREVQFFFAKNQNYNTLKYKFNRIRLIIKYIIYHPKYFIFYISYLFRLAYKVEVD